jgi:hypothetical protein
MSIRKEPNLVPERERMWLTVREAAGHASVTSNLLYMEMSAGRLPWYHLNGDPKREKRILREDLINWMNGSLARRLESERQQKEA